MSSPAANRCSSARFSGFHSHHPPALPSVRANSAERTGPPWRIRSSTRRTSSGWAANQERDFPPPPRLTPRPSLADTLRHAPDLLGVGGEPGAGLPAALQHEPPVVPVILDRNE